MLHRKPGERAVTEQAKWTPGPWGKGVAFRPDTGLGQRVVVVAPAEGANDGMVVCWAMGPDKEANARLIAAAPEMYEALKTLVAEWDRSLLSGEAYEIARDAIAKAEGRS
jgi:hypothetical protein